jgi:hypothetical protein
MIKITEDEYFMGRDAIYACPEEVRINARALLEKVNNLIQYIYMNFDWVDFETKPNGSIVSSGWRPAQVNANTPGASPKSKHMTGHAVDIYDPDGDIDEVITDELLEKFGLYREHPSATKGWCHLQDIPPKSKRRTFYP